MITVWENVDWKEIAEACEICLQACSKELNELTTKYTELEARYDRLLSTKQRKKKVFNPHNFQVFDGGRKVF